MAKGKNQRLKLLYLAKIMQEETDETHGLTMPEIISRLSEYGIDAQRKSLYQDIAALNDYGYDIIKANEGYKTYYHMVSREFEMAELKFLVDAIQSSRFMTERKTKELIEKLETLLSNYDAKLIKRQVYVTGRVKSMNESIYYSVDKIHTAINENKQVTFQYFKWNVDGEQELRHDGKVYKVSPWALVFDDENYYLVAYDAEEDKIKHYRVDKMLYLEVTDAKRKGAKIFKGMDKAQYTNKCFGMFGGKEERVVLRCHNDMANVIIDRFGLDTKRIKIDDDHFEVRIDVQMSEQFLGWIIALGDGVEIVGPKNVVRKMSDITKRLSQTYK